MSEGLYLTIPENLLKKIKQEMDLYSYFSVQEVILETLRNRFLRSNATSKGTKRGRPRTPNPLDILGRKKIFAD